MAPKRCKQTLVPLEPIKTVAVDASLLDKEQAKDQAATLKRKRPSRSSDDVVAKILQDNFKSRGWSADSFDLVLRNGVSLRESIKAAKIRHDAGLQIMGKVYYDALRSLYSDADSPAVQMKVLDPTQPVDQTVSDAITAITNHRSDRGPMTAMFSSNYIPNQKSLVAMFRVVCDLQPGTNVAVADFFIEMLSYIVRNDLHNKHKQIFDLLRPRLDAALDKHWMVWKSSGLSSSMWFDVHEPYIGAIVDKVSLKRCFETKSNWMEVADDLAVVVQSAVGARIFLSKYRGLAGQRVIAQIEKECAELDKSNATVALVSQLQAICQQKCLESGKVFHELFDLAMEIKMDYRGVAIKVMARSLQEVFLYNMAARIKGRAVALGELEPLWCENELAGPTSSPTLKIESALLRTYKLARQAAMDLLPDGHTGVAIKNTLQSRQKMLSSLDKDWGIEHHFFLGMVGEMGEAALRKKILDALPGSDRSVTVDDSSAALAELESSKLYSFVDVGCQTAFSKVKELVGSIKLQRQPRFPSPCSDFLSTVKERLSYFCNYEETAGTDKAAVSNGRAACKKHLQAMEVRMAANETLSLADVTTLQVFSWLLQPAEQQRLTAITDIIMKGVVCEALVATVAPKTSGAKAKKLADDKNILKKKQTSSYFD
jgi:hypothetical protein